MFNYITARIVFAYLVIAFIGSFVYAIYMHGAIQEPMQIFSFWNLIIIGIAHCFTYIGTSLYKQAANGEIDEESTLNFWGGTLIIAALVGYCSLLVVKVLKCLGVGDLVTYTIVGAFWGMLVWTPFVVNFRTWVIIFKSSNRN